MKFPFRLPRPVPKWCLIFASALTFIGGVFACFRRSTPYPFGPAVYHKSGITFDRFVYSDRRQYGVFSVTNGYPYPIMFMLWDVESSRSNEWRSQLRTVQKPGELPENGFSAALGIEGSVDPGATASIFVQRPKVEGNWRARVLISRGLDGYRWQDRFYQLSHGPIKTAFTLDPFYMTNYFRFRPIGLIDSPIVTWSNTNTQPSGH